eukprot:TRINITY_DN6331_c0_g1_i1.p1 TRINITY_DN6331_c0_g1~~TRINITY_DN6331_c0_g1_i1.p1  ORF type:complete len:275 (+),score=27.73 TRINITY_DN6331_c0_g1_i1:74-898(+)
MMLAGHVQDSLSARVSSSWSKAFEAVAARGVDRQDNRCCGLLSVEGTKTSKIAPPTKDVGDTGNVSSSKKASPESMSRMVHKDSQESEKGVVAGSADARMAPLSSTYSNQEAETGSSDNGGVTVDMATKWAKWQSRRTQKKAQRAERKTPCYAELLRKEMTSPGRMAYDPLPRRNSWSHATTHGTRMLSDAVPCLLDLKMRLPTIESGDEASTPDVSPRASKCRLSSDKYNSNCDTAIPTGDSLPLITCVEDESANEADELFDDDFSSFTGCPE